MRHMKHPIRFVTITPDPLKDLSRALRFAQEALIAPTADQARYFFSLSRFYWAAIFRHA